MYNLKEAAPYICGIFMGLDTFYMFTNLDLSYLDQLYPQRYEKKLEKICLENKCSENKYLAL